MAGYGNVNAPDLSPSDLEKQHSETRFGRDDSHPYSNPHETYGSGTTGGAGFGNSVLPTSHFPSRLPKYVSPYHLLAAYPLVSSPDLNLTERNPS